MDKIISYDQELLIFLNNLGSESFDAFWLIITKLSAWIPLFILLLYVLFKKVGMKQLGLILVVLAFLILCTDQTSNLFKYSVERLRPCFEPGVMEYIRIVKKGGMFSFFSGHATNSMGATVFLVLILRRYYKYTSLLFLFPILFAYSRIYLGLHYPLDIIVGYLFGAIYAILFFKIYLYFERKYFSE